MYSVSGCPRSGTSLMMDCHRVAFGEKRIRGHKFPQEKRIETILTQQEGETDAIFKCKKYVFEKKNPNWKEELEKSKDMNPNGFWEDKYSVKGIFYNFHNKEELKEILEEKEKSVYKIVSQGLAQSDPRFIDKVVFMVRHPRAVAKSQERLKRDLKFKTIDGQDVDLGKDVVIHTPEMYNKVTVMASKFILDNPDIPVHFVNFDDLISDPVNVLKGVQDFYGEGNFEEAAKLIDPKLKRSYPEEVENDLWGDAEFIYNKFNEQAFQEILDYMEDDLRATNRQQGNWDCTRTGLITVEGHCRECKADPAFRKKLKEFADDRRIDWTVEPCIYECGFDLDNDPISIEDSIKNNFWLE